MTVLNQLQIQHIESFLIEHYKLYYIDIRAEVLDHIASDIEKLMESNKTFEEAFILVIPRWNKDLKISKRFYKGVPNFLAKIWIKERLLRFFRNLVGGFILLALSLFYINADIYYEIVVETMIVLLLGSGILFFKSKKLIENEPLDTAKGVFLRLELKHNYTYKLAGLLMMFPTFFLVTFFNIPLNILPSIWLFITSIYFFDRLIWYKEYQQEKLFKVKFNLHQSITE